MNRRALIALAAGGSAALLIGALAFQYLGGLPPCALCHWQRYPHVAAVVIGAAGVLFPLAALALAGAGAATLTAGIGAYHVGVEQRWWAGPSTCSAGEVGDVSASELLEQILAAPVVRCDEIAWSLAGISMAGWNALLSTALACVWLAAWGRRRVT
ncbi:MAG: disulfide bond formation protein B [Pseudomonadota bacterium]